MHLFGEKCYCNDKKNEIKRVFQNDSICYISSDRLIWAYKGFGLLSNLGFDFFFIEN